MDFIVRVQSVLVYIAWVQADIDKAAVNERSSKSREGVGSPGYPMPPDKRIGMFYVMGLNASITLIQWSINFVAQDRGNIRARAG